MNVEEMRKRAAESARVAGDLKADDDDDGLEVGDVLKDRREYAFAAGALAADVLALLAERGRLAEEHDGILSAPSVEGSPQMVAGKVLRIEFHRQENGPIEVTTKMVFVWSEVAARAAAIGCGETVTLVLDKPSAVRAAYGEKARLEALLAALRSVDERELPEHVAAALRAVDGGAT